MTPSPGDMIKKYLEIRDYLKRRDDEYAAAIEPYKNAQTAIENALLAHLNEAKLDNCKGDAGTAYKTTQTSVRVADSSAFLGYVRTHEMFDLLAVHAAKTNVEKFVDDFKEPPPGIDITRFVKVNVRRK